MLVSAMGVVYGKGYDEGVTTLTNSYSNRDSGKYINFLESKINECYSGDESRYGELIAYEKSLEKFKDIYKI